MQVACQIRFFESQLYTMAVCLAAIVCGLCAGLLVHGIAWRSSHGKPAWKLGTSCRSCGHSLSTRDSLPLLGWLRLHGRCPHCGDELGMDAPACELLCGLVFASIALRFGVSAQTLEVMAIACVLMVAALTSLWDYRIPNGCIIAAVLVRMAYLAFLAATGTNVVELALASLAGAMALGIPLALAVFLSNAMLARDVSGMGTVKLTAVVGLYLGWQQGLLCMAGSCLLLALVWLVSPTKLQDVEVAGGAHRQEDPKEAGAVVNPRFLRATYEEDIAEPMRLIPFAPAIAIVLWSMLLLGVAPSAWNTPLF